MFKPFTCFIQSMKHFVNLVNGTAIIVGLGQNWCNDNRIGTELVQ
jgi:hypothetical protein